MTTAARPTPAQMPSRRPDTPAAKETPRPSAHREPWQKAILASSLPANCRFVAIALSTHADGTGHIAQQPRLIGLVHNTGINARQVAVALTALRDRGFLRLSPHGGRYDTADLVLTMPRGAAARARRAAGQTDQPTP